MNDIRDRLIVDTRASANEPPPSILVVESDPADLQETVRVLRSFGYRVAGTSRFDEAKEMLANDPPHLLMTGVKLGVYNGLHLIVRGHWEHPEMAAILTSHSHDPVLQADAEGQHATYLIRPWNSQELLRVVAHSLEDGRTRVHTEETARSADGLTTSI